MDFGDRVRDSLPVNLPYDQVRDKMAARSGRPGNGILDINTTKESEIQVLHDQMLDMLDARSDRSLNARRHPIGTNTKDDHAR